MTQTASAGRRLLRNSERQTFKRCRHQWEWSFGKRREPVHPSLALSFGDMIHIALAAYYIPGTTRGEHPANTFTKLYAEREEHLRATGWYEDDEEGGRDWQDAGELGVRMLEGYVEEWSARDEEYEVLSSEQTFQLRLRTPAFRAAPHLKPRREFFWIVGTFDGVWRHLPSGDILFPEHKTTKAINTDAQPMDEQAGTYWTYGPKWLRTQQIIGDDESLQYILYNYLRKSAPDPDGHYDDLGRKLNKPKKDALLAEFGRMGKVPKSKLVDDMIEELGERAWQLGEVSKVQPAPYFDRTPAYRDRTDRERMHARILEEYMEMRMVEEGFLFAYKNPGPQHMPNCRGCPFRDPCELHETGNDWEEMYDSITQPWDPYAAHELVERR